MKLYLLHISSEHTALELLRVLLVCLVNCPLLVDLVLGLVENIFETRPTIDGEAPLHYETLYFRLQRLAYFEILFQSISLRLPQRFVSSMKGFYKAVLKFSVFCSPL